MKKTACQLAAAALALLILCVICRFCFFRTYPMYYHLAPVKLAAAQARGFRIVSADPSVASAGPAEIRDGVLRIPVIPGQRGETTLELQDAEGRSLGFIPVRVTRFQTVYESVSGGFSGDSMAMAASTVFWIFACFIMIRSFCRARGPAFYRHDTIYYAGFALFSGITGLNLFAATLRHLVHPESYSMLELYSALSGASMQFLRLTAPLAVIFAIFMAAGNIALFLRVRPRARNALGLGVSLLLVLGIAAGLRLYSLDFSGSEWEMRIRSALLNTYATVFVYFECMLTGSVICGLISAHHIPSLPRDFIIILGCWFRPDGSLPPLIRGRVDRALAYWRKQRESTGLEAVFVPSGGQGPDESMPEAEAMRRYLLAQGIPEQLILPESASRNTLENMQFSREIILARNPHPRVIFSTTGYHVFRSGVWASLAGLPAEGIGSRTKWWFWPNAFMRETVGLLQKRWKQELLFLGALLAYFLLLTFFVG